MPKAFSTSATEFIPFSTSSSAVAYQNQYLEWYKYNHEWNKKRKVAFKPRHDTNYGNVINGSNDEEIASSVGESEEASSIVESLHTQSSKGSGIQNETSVEERRLEQRQKQIDYGKVIAFLKLQNTIGYQKYLEAVPRGARKGSDPQTPEKHSKCSKRAWDGLVRSWRYANY